MFVRRAVLLMTSIALLAGTSARAAEDPQALSPEYFRTHTAPADASFFISNTPKTERGDRMVVRGLVTDGKAPVANASVYIFHADNDGRYNPARAIPGEGWETPRLHGYMRTDSVGRYVYGNVYPKPYPGGTMPARVRFVVTAEGFKNRAIEVWFEGDPMITAELKARQAQQPDAIYIRPVKRDTNRVWQITNDIVLERN